MTKSKTKNKLKIQMPNIKIAILSFGICHLCLFWILCFGICHLTFAQEDNKLVTLAKQIIEEKNTEKLYALFEQLTDLYFFRTETKPEGGIPLLSGKENKYSELVEFLQSLDQKNNILEPFVNYYIGLSRYHQLKYLENTQKWDEYFNKGNAYREQLAQSIQKTIDTTNTTVALNLYSRLLLWQFHKDQQDASVDSALSDLMNVVLEYSAGTKEAKPIKDVGDKLLAYGEKAKSKEIYKIYVNKIVASDINDNQLRDIALGFYKEGKLELSEAIYDVYIERIIKLYSKAQSISLLIDIARNFSYGNGVLNKDGFYAEKIFQEIEEISAKGAFDEELTYLRAFNLEKIKEYIKAKDLYIDLVNRFPKTTHADEADFKAGVICVYVLRDIKTGRAYFEKLAHSIPLSANPEPAEGLAQKETLSPQVISSLYQLGLLSQWENDLAKAKDYYKALIEKVKDGFVETAALAKERLKEVSGLRPMEYNLKTFLDVSLQERNVPLDPARLDLISSGYRINKGEDAHIGSAPYNIESGCMQVETQYLWSGHLGTAKPSPEQSAFDTTYTEAGTKEINLVIISPAGIVDRNIEIVDVY